MILKKFGLYLDGAAEFECPRCGKKHDVTVSEWNGRPLMCETFNEPLRYPSAMDNLRDSLRALGVHMSGAHERFE